MSAPAVCWQLTIKINLKAQRKVCLRATMLNNEAEIWNLEKRGTGTYGLADDLESVESVVGCFFFLNWRWASYFLFLRANVSHEKFPTVQLLWTMSASASCHHGVFRCSAQAHWEKRHWHWGICSRLLLQPCQSLSRLRKISDRSEIHPMAGQKQIISPHSPLVQGTDNLTKHNLVWLTEDISQAVVFILLSTAFVICAFANWF